MRYNFRRFIKLATILAVINTLGACSGIGTQSQAPEEIVRVRAFERWQALIDGRLETAYTYLSPEYRKIYSYQQYSKTVHGVGLWSKAEVKDVACKENCVVSMQIHVTMRPARWGDTIETSSLLKEQWMRDKDSGEWFHLSSE